jgi:hypothetical protein
LNKYYIEVTRTVCVEAQDLSEATTVALYATHYPDDLEGVYYVNHKFEHLSNYSRMDG